MLRVAPLVFIAVNETEEDDRDPRINEDRIEKHVKPSLPFRADLKENDQRQNILAEHDCRHEL